MRAKITGWRIGISSVTYSRGRVRIPQCGVDGSMELYNIKFVQVRCGIKRTSWLLCDMCCDRYLRCLGVSMLLWRGWWCLCWILRALTLVQYRELSVQRYIGCVRCWGFDAEFLEFATGLGSSRVLCAMIYTGALGNLWDIIGDPKGIPHDGWVDGVHASLIGLGSVGGTSCLVLGVIRVLWLLLLLLSMLLRSTLFLV